MASRDERDPGRTTFHWEANVWMEAAVPEAGIFNQLGFWKRAGWGTQPVSRSRVSTYGDYRYAVPFWFLALVLVLPAVYWIHGRTRQPAPSAKPAILETGETA
jgi:hypothetical protein